MSEIDSKSFAISLKITNNTDLKMRFYKKFFNPGRMEEGSEEGKIPDVIEPRQTKTLNACGGDLDPFGVSFDLEYVINEESLEISTRNVRWQSNKIGVTTDEDGNKLDPVKDYDFQSQVKQVCLGNRYFKITYQCSQGDINRAVVTIDHDYDREKAVSATMAKSAQNNLATALTSLKDKEADFKKKRNEAARQTRDSLDKFIFHLDQTERRSVRGDSVCIEAHAFTLNQDELDKAAPYDLAIYADTVTMGGKLRFPAKNLLISARVIRLSGDCEITTSVDDVALRSGDYVNMRSVVWRDFSALGTSARAPEKANASLLPPRGASAQFDSHRSLDGKHGEDGTAGMDGNTGLDAGNVVLLAGRIENGGYGLSVYSAGGRGGRGQDGSDGGDGGDGGKNPNRTSTYTGENSMPKWRALAYARWWSHEHGRGGWAGSGGDAGRSGKGGKGGQILIRTLEPLAFASNKGPVGYVNGGPGGAAAAAGKAGKVGQGGHVITIKDVDDGGRTVKVRAPDGCVGKDGKTGNTGAKGENGTFAVEVVTVGAFRAGSLIGPDLPASSLDQWRIAFRAAKAAYLLNDVNGAFSVLNWLSDVLGIAADAGGRVSDEAVNLITAMKIQVDARLRFLHIGLDCFGRSFEYVPVQSLARCKERSNAILTTAEAVEAIYRETYDMKKSGARSAEAVKGRLLQVGEKIESTEKEQSEAAETRTDIEQRLGDLTKSLVAQESALREAHAKFVTAVERGQQIKLFTSVLSITAQAVMISTGSYAASRMVGLAGSAVSTGIKAFSSNDPAAASPLLKHMDTRFLSLTKTAEAMEKELKGRKDASGDKAEGDLADAKKRLRTAQEDVAALPAIPALWNNPLDRDPAELGRPRSSSQPEAGAGKGVKLQLLSRDLRPADRPRAASMPALAQITSTAVKEPAAAAKGTDWVAKGTSAVLQVVPLLDDLGDAVRVGSDLLNLQQQFGFDAVKLAIDQNAFDAMKAKALAYIDEQQLKPLREAFDAYAKLARQRNDLLIQYQANYLKAVERDAGLHQARFESAVLTSGLANAGDRLAATLHAYWQSIYDTYRDLALDCIYDEYRAFRYYALEEAGFDSSIMAIGKQSARKTAATVIAKSFGNYAMNQNVATLRLLHDAVIERAFKAHGDIFSGRQKVSNRKLTYAAASEEVAALRKDRKATVGIPVDHPELADIARFYISSIKVLLPGLRTANGKVAVEVSHPGAVEVRDTRQNRFSFQHDPITNEGTGASAVYIYKTIDTVRVKDLPPEDNRAVVLTMDNTYYVEVEAPKFDGEKAGYIELSPFTSWTIRLPEKSNPGLNLNDLSGVVIQLIGRATAIRQD